MQSYDNRQPSRSNSGVSSYLPAPTTATWIYAAIGAVVGLLIGLFIAWIIWPVQWTNAWPADLSQEARAQYLAAVSEAYVYYGDAEAAEVARNRLFNLNDNLPAYIADAQKFFVDNPQANSRVYISNLGQLAKALNIQSPDIIQDAPVEAAPASAQTTTSSDVGNSVRAWVNWALMILAAIVLVGGGFYIVGRLNQRRLASVHGDTLDDGGFDDEPGDALRPAPANANQPNPYMRPLRGASVSTTIPTSVTPRNVPPQRQSEDYGFDDDDDLDDDIYTRGTSTRALDYRSEDEIFDEPDDELLEDDILDDPLDDPLDQMNAGYQASPTVLPVGVIDDDLEEEEQTDTSHTDVAPQTASVAAAAAVTPTPTGRTSAPVRTLNTYTFQYHAGIADYDQSRPIIDPESGLQVGDCGMGVNMKNNIVQNNPDNVIALDVWLVDKKAEKSFSSQDRVLLSEYVVDHNLESTFTRERPNDPSPIIPQPGTTFQIKGPSLTLDCVVTEVSYIKNNAAAGMFQSLSIDMTVRSRT
jgi:hypothetical protein